MHSLYTSMKTSQQALQADRVTPLAVISETRLALSRADKRLTLDALIVEDLDVDVLAGTPFMIANDISVRPAKREVLIQGSEVISFTICSPAPSPMLTQFIVPILFITLLRACYHRFSRKAMTAP